MQKIRAAYPYDDRGRPRFKDRDRPGVYVIIENGVPVYVGMSKTDLYKTMYRHFQQWNDRTQVRVTYNPNNPAIKTRVVYTNTPNQAATLERALIIKLAPRDNPQKLLNYTTSPSEENAYRQYVETETESIKQYEGDSPF